MQSYKSSNKIGRTGLVWLISAAAVGGVTIGAIASVVSLLLYLVILFPIFMGLSGAVVMSLAVNHGKVRNPLVAGIFGMIMGGIISGTMQLGGYIQFQQSAAAEINEEFGQVDQKEINYLLDSYLEEETGDKGFFGYVKYSAKQGVTIGKISSQGSNLGEAGTWIYWVCELLAIQVFIAYIAYQAASKPFSESSNQWYGEPVEIANINLNKSFLNLLHDEHFTAAGKLIDPLEILYYPHLQISIQSCSGDCDLILGVNTISSDKKGNLTATKNLQGVISQADLAKFQEGTIESRSQLGKEVTEQQILAAISERKPPFATSDKLESHKLGSARESKLVEQISRLGQVKKAYLVRKTLKYFPERPLYILGIIRAKGIIESEEAESNLIETLRARIELPNQTQIVILNQNKEFLKTIIKVQSEPIYQA